MSSRLRRLLAREDGETLVEVMMTVAIVSIAVITIVTGIGAAIRFSSSHRSSANSGIAVVAGAEAVKSYSGGSATCATLTPSTYSAALVGVPVPTGWTLSISAASCVAVNGASLPKVTVVATSPDGNAVESVDVVRRSLT